MSKLFEDDWLRVINFTNDFSPKQTFYSTGSAEFPEDVLLNALTVMITSARLSLLEKLWPSAKAGSTNDSNVQCKIPFRFNNVVDGKPGLIDPCHNTAMQEPRTEWLNAKFEIGFFIPKQITANACMKSVYGGVSEALTQFVDGKYVSAVVSTGLPVVTKIPSDAALFYFDRNLEG